MILCLIPAAALLLFIGFRLNAQTNLHDNELIRIRAHWPQTADVVLAGDSRVMIDVSPEKMKNTFPDKNILNFSFFANGYTLTYFQAISSLFNPKNPHPILILGITPHSLTSRASEINGFNTQPENNITKNHLLQTLQENITDFFEPQNLRQLGSAFLPGKGYRQQRFHLDGWLSIVSPIHPTDEIEPYRKVFFDNTVTPSIIDNLIRQTRQWSQAGIRVYAFRPPTTEKMIALENKISGFDEIDFVTRFSDAGGTWLSVNQTGYTSYDGSHLHRDAALRFSHDLAKLIDEYESQPSAQLAAFPQSPSAIK